MSFRVIVQPTAAQVEAATAPIRAALAAVRLPSTVGGTYRVTVTHGEDTYLATPAEANEQVRAYTRDVDYGPTYGTEINVYQLQDDGSWTHERRLEHEGHHSWGTWRRPGSDWI